LKLANILINLGLNLLFFLKFRWGIEAIFAANLAASVVTLLLLIPEILRKLKIKIHGVELKKMLRFGLPYLPASLAATMVQVIDRPVVLAMTDAGTLGLYQTGYKLGIFMMLVVSMFQYAWQPFFLNNAKEKNAREIFAKIMTLFVLAASLLWIFISLFIENLARLEIGSGRTIIGKDFLPGLVVVPIILLAYLFNGIYVNLWAGLYIEEKTKYFPYITGAGALVNVLVNIVLIPVLGIVGAALATLSSYLVMAAAIFIFAQRFYKIDYEYGKLLKILATVFAVAILYYYGYYHGGLTIVYKGLLLLGFVAALLVLRVVEKMEMARLFKILLRRRS